MNCPTKRQQGAALVVALLILALCASLAATLLEETQQSMRRTQQSLLDSQLRQYLLGAEALAATLLAADQRQASGQDHLGELWARPIPPFALDGGGWLSASMVDAQGLFDLNSLVLVQDGRGGVDQPYSVHQLRFIRLLQLVGDGRIDAWQAQQLMSAVVDWLDRDSRPRGMEEAEADYYQQLEPPYLPANAALQSVSELRLVRGFDGWLYRRLLPYLVVLPTSTGEINVNTAPVEILATLDPGTDLQPLDPASLQSLLGEREANGFASLEAFWQASVWSADAVNQGRSVVLNSHYFLLTLQVELADAQRRQQALLARYDTRQQVVQRWPLGLSLPEGTEASR